MADSWRRASSSPARRGPTTPWCGSPSAGSTNSGAWRATSASRASGSNASTSRPAAGAISRRLLERDDALGGLLRRIENLQTRAARRSDAPRDELEELKRKLPAGAPRRRRRPDRGSLRSDRSGVAAGADPGRARPALVAAARGRGSGMRIAELHLDAFGPFSDRRLALGGASEPGLCVIYGPNEAGKSSALRAIRGPALRDPPSVGRQLHPPPSGSPRRRAAVLSGRPLGRARPAQGHEADAASVRASRASAPSSVCRR